MGIDEAKLGELMGRLVGDLGAVAAAPLVVIGDRLGLYKTMAAAGPMTPEALAARAGVNERYLREWLNSQAAGGYVTYDAGAGTYCLTEEQAAALAVEDSPAFVQGGFQCAVAMYAALDRLERSFRTGDGIPWGEQHPCLFEGTFRFFRPAYMASLLSEWIPSLDGVQQKLERGGTVADVGCGQGFSTVLMAKAFPASRFVGFDSHAGSIEAARRWAEREGVGERVSFEVARSTDFPGGRFDLVAHFDCLHDMEDPAGAARHARKRLASDGTWMIIEPMAGDHPEENHNPIGRVFYSASTQICVPHSLSQGGPALGVQAREARLRRVVVDEGGFSSMRVAHRAPFNLILEARP